MKRQINSFFFCEKNKIVVVSRVSDYLPLVHWYKIVLVVLLLIFMYCEI